MKLAKLGVRRKRGREREDEEKNSDPEPPKSAGNPQRWPALGKRAGKKTKGKIVSGCNFKQNKYSRKDFSSYNPDMTQAQSTCSLEFKCVFSH